MTLPPDSRQIDAESEQYNAELIRREDETEDLAYFCVRMKGEPVSFEPGQYLTIGVYADGRIVQRPYSVASCARTTADGYEFYVRLVPILRFTTLLWRLPLGHGMRLTGPKGRFMLEPDDQRAHLFISTGTGIAPFMSMIRTLLHDGERRRIVLCQGVSYQSELGYEALLHAWEADPTFDFTYVPTISRARDARNAGWSGRTGRVETVLDEVCDDLGLTPDGTVAYICGNPEMILNAEEVLQRRGLPEPHVKKELYWPKGKPNPPAIDATTGRVVATSAAREA